MELVSARCTQCGGEIQLDKEKETGYCLHCGSKILVKEAIKRIQIDNSHLIENYYALTNAALDSKNYSEVEKYCNKIIEIDSKDINAWYLKGKAVGWQSTVENFRISESVACWINTLKIGKENDAQNLQALVENILEESFSVSQFVISIWFEKFRKSPDLVVSSEFIRNLKELKKLLLKVIDATSGEEASVEKLFSSLVQSINNISVDAYQNIIKIEYFGDDNHSGDHDVAKYIDRITACTNLLEHSLNYGNEIEPIKATIYKNLIRLHNHALTARYSSLSSGNKGSKLSKKEVIAANQKLIAKYNNELQILNAELKINEEKINEQEENRKIKNEEKYWSEHPEEHHIFLDITSNLKKLYEERSELPFYKTVEKSKIDQQIDSLEKQLKEIQIHR